MVDQALVILVDLGVVVLLGVAIYYAIKLRKGLQAFQESKEDFDRLILQLVKATEQADQTIDSFRHNAEEIGKKLQKEIDESRTLFDELQFMNDAGNNLAARLEKLSQKANEAHGNVSDDKKSKKTKSSPKTTKRKRAPSKAEKELLEAVRARKG